VTLAHHAAAQIDVKSKTPSTTQPSSTNLWPAAAISL